MNKAPLKVLLTFGTRPEAIKMAPIIQELKAHPTDFEVKVCVTGQHREMLDHVLKLFGIEADYDFNLAARKLDLSQMTGEILLQLREVFQKEKPGLVLVQGDTNTTFAGSLAAFHHLVPVGHVEAGLRTWNKSSPWPEEINRRLTTQIADFHFCPTVESMQNLLQENIQQAELVVTGNTSVDALLHISERIDQESDLRNEILEELEQELPFDLCEDPYILITTHRRENYLTCLDEICKAVKHLHDKNPKFHFVLPVHLNPKVKSIIEKNLTGSSRLHLITPQTYRNFVFLMKHAYFLLTDSGGIQEEAPYLQKPVLLLRDTTERPEAAASGCVEVVGTEFKAITAAAARLINDPDAYRQMVVNANVYGDGTAAKQIVNLIKDRIDEEGSVRTTGGMGSRVLRESLT